MNSDFPHDSIADQQFDEPQFESYRELGFLAGRSVGFEIDQNDDVAKRFKDLDSYYQKTIKAIDAPRVKNVTIVN